MVATTMAYRDTEGDSPFHAFPVLSGRCPRRRPAWRRLYEQTLERAEAAEALHSRGACKLSRVSDTQVAVRSVVG